MEIKYWNHPVRSSSVNLVIRKNNEWITLFCVNYYKDFERFDYYITPYADLLKENFKEVVKDKFDRLESIYTELRTDANILLYAYRHNWAEEVDEIMVLSKKRREAAMICIANYLGHLNNLYDFLKGNEYYTVEIKKVPTEKRLFEEKDALENPHNYIPKSPGFGFDINRCGSIFTEEK